MNAEGYRRYLQAEGNLHLHCGYKYVAIPSSGDSTYTAPTYHDADRLLHRSYFRGHNCHHDVEHYDLDILDDKWEESVARLFDYDGGILRVLSPSIGRQCHNTSPCGGLSSQLCQHSVDMAR